MIAMHWCGGSPVIPLLARPKSVNRRWPAASRLRWQQIYNIEERENEGKELEWRKRRRLRKR